jgi:hypothetical protein
VSGAHNDDIVLFRKAHHSILEGIWIFDLIDADELAGAQDTSSSQWHGSNKYV